MNVGDCHSQGFRSLSNNRGRQIILTHTLARSPGVLVLSRPAGRLSVHCQLRVLSVVGSLRVAILTTLRSLDLTTRFYSRLCLVGRNRVMARNRPRTIVAPRGLHQVFSMRTYICPDPVGKGLVVRCLWRGHKDAPRGRRGL